jgi:hypothetical protein
MKSKWEKNDSKPNVKKNYNKETSKCEEKL